MTSDGTYYVIYPGIVQAVLFPAKVRIGRGEWRSRELARRMAQAFARREKSELVKVFNFLGDIRHHVPELEAIIHRIDVELARMTRLSITALIGNTGGTPVSLSKQTCQVELLLDGYTYRIAEDEGGKPRERRGNIRLEMVLLDDDGNPIEPLAIEAGGVRAVRAVYGTPLSNEGLPEGGTLYDLLDTALEGAERTWRLTIDAVLQRDASRAITSRKISFRDVQSSGAQVGAMTMSERERTLDELGQRLRSQENELSASRTELANTRVQLSEVSRQAEALFAQLQAMSSVSGPAAPPPQGAGVSDGVGGSGAAP
jgi:hypothetical protein